MIQQIFKQLWNKRRANAWIFIELLLVAFFMWGAIDPVYVLLSNKAIPPGFDADHVFLLNIRQRPSTHNKYNEELDTDSMNRESFLRIYNMVRQYPGVESAVITHNQGHPHTVFRNRIICGYDSLSSDVLHMEFYHDGDYFGVFKMRDIYTGKRPDHRNPPDRSVYITEDVAGKLFPGGNAVGNLIFQYIGDDTIPQTVRGVVPNFRFRPGEQPYPTGFFPSTQLEVEDLPWGAQICFRIHDGLSMNVFAESFKQELASQLSIGNLYFLRLDSFDTIRKNVEYQSGVTNKLRLQTALAAFFLICTFLGIAGTFWLRANARRGEIGLRMAMGRSRRGILKEFLTESWLLTTIACAIGIFFVFQRVYLTGFAEPPEYANDAYIQNRFVPHFLIVSFIVYALILAISTIGTWIPASRAARIEPAEALRDE